MFANVTIGNFWVTVPTRDWTTQSPSAMTTSPNLVFVLWTPRKATLQWLETKTWDFEERDPWDFSEEEACEFEGSGAGTFEYVGPRRVRWNNRTFWVSQTNQKGEVTLVDEQDETFWIMPCDSKVFLDWLQSNE